MAEAYGIRLSLCCGRIGCRRRVLPPSVLFWGRRVYWAAVFLVVVALRQGRTRGYTVERLKALFGVTRPTLARWMRYFQQVFPTVGCGGDCRDGSCRPYRRSSCRRA
jgi:hypothetical protein